MQEVKDIDYNVIRPLDNPYHKEGGLAVLSGNIAPDGAVVKQAAVAEEMLIHEARPGSLRVKKLPVRLYPVVRLSQEM